MVVSRLRRFVLLSIYTIPRRAIVCPIDVRSQRVITRIFVSLGRLVVLEGYFLYGEGNYFNVRYRLEGRR